VVERPILPVASQVPGLAWPAVLAGEGAVVLALLAQLQHAEWLDPAALHAEQDRQLAGLLRHARDSIAFYRRRLEVLGPELDLARWSELPLLERSELQAAGVALRSNEVPRAHGALKTIRTSGSTGVPVEVERAAIAGVFTKALMLRERLWHRRDDAARLAAIRAVPGDAQAARPPGRREPGWGAATAHLLPRGEGFLLDVHVPLEAQWQWLREVDPHYLVTYPSNLRGLLELPPVEAGDRLPSLRQVKTVGEVVDENLRTRCAELLGAVLVDEYSAQECGSIAVQCPDHPHYHVQAETMRVEVLQDDGRPCAPGEVGRVVVTPLQEFRTPLLRYALGDYAEVGPPCPCGRGLPVLRRILGRARNLVTLPDGTRRWPLAGDGRYREIAPIRQYQFVQHAPQRFEVRLVTERPLTPAEEEAFRAWVQARFGYDFSIDLVYREALERHPSGKFEDFINAIPG